MELMTDDVVFENTSGGRFEGQDSVRAVLARAFELMSSGWFETEQTIALGDHVVVLWAYAFDKQNPERGHIRGADIFRVRDGRVAEAVLRQVGGLCPEVRASDYERLSLVDAGR